MANDQPYSGPISGVVNARTRGLLKMWVERDWHCPVVVEARVLEPATTSRCCATPRRALTSLRW